MSHDTLVKENELERKGYDNITSVRAISSDEQMAESIKDLNFNYFTLYEYATAIEDVYYQVYLPVVEYFKENWELLYDSLSLAQNSSNDWFDFLTTVQSYSAKWIKPMTIFYPTIIEDPLDEQDINNITSWIKTHFPIKNDDGTLNFLENQYFVVNCYSYGYSQDINVLDQPSSYTYCVTRNGTINLHCITIISGGVINCHQGSYNCDGRRDCYPSLVVDCWYESPYLKADGTPINTTDPVSIKQTTISKIQANLTMKYKDRRETSIKTLVFKVLDCEWVYTGSVLPFKN